MEFAKRNNKMQRISISHVDAELHTSTHAKSGFYHYQNHEQYENKALPVDSNSLLFKEVLNKNLLKALYTDKQSTSSASSEFKSNLFYFYCYYVLSLLAVLGFEILLFFSQSLNSVHFQVHLICALFLIFSSFCVLIAVQKKPLVLKSRTLFLVLSIVTSTYCVLADERVLSEITGVSYTKANQIFLNLILVTQIPMLRLIFFDSFLHICIYGLYSFSVFTLAHLVLTPYSKYSSLSEISLLGIFTLIQIIETYRSDFRTKQVFWRREKEIIVSNEIISNYGHKSFGINSEIDIIMDICEHMKKKLKDVSKVIMHNDTKKIIKDISTDIEKIKWKAAHKDDLNLEIDPNIDEEDQKYIKQNFLAVTTSYNDHIIRSATELYEAPDKSPIQASIKFALHEIEAMLSPFGKSWNFDMFYIKESLGQTVSIIGTYLLAKWSLLSLYSIPEETSQKYFEQLEKAYIQNPYHNACHAADVMHSLLFFILNSSLHLKIDSLEMLACVISTLGHDVAHPGLTNRFLVNNKDDLALEYNDRSVLENMHCSTIYKILKKPGCDIFKALSLDDWQNVRSLIVNMVLSTDMSKHFDLLGQFRARVIGLKDIELNSADDKQFILSFGLKCADIGHSAKNTDLHRKWSMLVCEELFAQGDLEKDRMQSVSMYCDRENTDIDKSQSGFLRNICIPLYEVWGLYLNSEVVKLNCIDQQVFNLKFWEKRTSVRKSTLKINYIDLPKRGTV